MTPVDMAIFVGTYFGISGLALWLLDRSHRRAFEKISAVYDKEMEHQAMLIDLLKLALDTLRSVGGSPNES